MILINTRVTKFAVISEGEQGLHYDFFLTLQDAVNFAQTVAKETGFDAHVFISNYTAQGKEFEEIPVHLTKSYLAQMRN